MFFNIDKLGYSTPTEIQENAIPVLLDGKDILGIAPTGTGKTLAFLLPAYEKLSAFPGKGIKTLILCPTRELALQIHQSALQLASNTKMLIRLDHV